MFRSLHIPSCVDIYVGSVSGSDVGGLYSSSFSSSYLSRGSDVSSSLFCLLCSYILHLTSFLFARLVVALIHPFILAVV